MDETINTGGVTNDDRAAYAALALDAYCWVTRLGLGSTELNLLVEEDQALVLQDILCDLQHFACSRRFDFEELLASASYNFKAEVAEAELNAAASSSLSEPEPKHLSPGFGDRHPGAQRDR